MQPCCDFFNLQQMFKNGMIKFCDLDGHWDTNFAMFYDFFWHMTLCHMPKMSYIVILTLINAAFFITI